MTLYIYNTVTRTKEPFQPINPDRVTMYVCGPTVYDYIHIGNARPAIFFDVVRRYLETLAYEVNYVVNFTDVDDKLIRKAAELGITVSEVAERFIQAFYEDLDELGIRRATNSPRVTENIGEIIAFICELVKRGIAYESGGDVYFRTKRFKKYGQISHQNMNELQLGIRVERDERKEDATDFVLWKAVKPGEISWPSPWGEGRPGWHIECSAILRKYLGETVDIHGGGQDLQFPHHECEAAQSESVTGKKLANVWMHNGYIQIDNEKMSKSLGNSITVQELRKRYNPTALRYFMLSTHYRNPLHFNAEVMEQAEKSVSRIENAFVSMRHALQSPCVDLTVQKDVDEALQAKLADIVGTFNAKMQDDFNTADAITAVFDWVSEANSYLQRSSEVLVASNLGMLLDAFDAMNRVLGLVLKEEEQLLDEDIERLIQERNDARKIKDWTRADEIRSILTKRGIILEDTPQGVRWCRK